MKRCILLVLLILSGCKAGPDFVRPAVPQANQYALPQTASDSAQAPRAGGDTTQHIVLGESVADQWWGLFGSAALDDLVRQAIEGSPTIAEATNTLAQAHELATAAGGALYPQVDATGGIGRQKYGKEFLGSFSVPPFSYVAGGLAVNYSFDNAGGIARSIEERRALLEYQRQELRAAHLALSGDVVSAVIGIAGAREQIRAIDDLLVEQVPFKQEKAFGTVDGQPLSGNSRCFYSSVNGRDRGKRQDSVPRFRLDDERRDPRAIFLGGEGPLAHTPAHRAGWVIHGRA